MKTNTNKRTIIAGSLKDSGNINNNNNRQEQEIIGLIYELLYKISRRICINLFFLILDLYKRV